MKLAHLAKVIPLMVVVTANLSCSAREWPVFSDPDGEFTIQMPAPVKADKTPEGKPGYESSEDDVTYRVSVNKRSNLDAAVEVKTYCDAFAESFERNMKERNLPVTRAECQEVSGKNWQGRLYQYNKTDGSFTTIEICVEPKHDIVLYAFGGAIKDANTQKFLQSFTVK